MTRSVHANIISRMDLAAFILAGGKSTRMGADKAFLELNGQTLLARALASASSVTSDVRIVGSRDRFARYAETLEDVFPDRGPLGGIHAALAGTQAELNLMLAVDVPFVTPEFLRYLVQQAKLTDALVMVPRAGGRLHPLCAVYRRRFLEIADPALREGRNKIDALFNAENARIVDEDELQRLSFPASMFDNLNTREEFDRASVVAQRRRE